MSNPVATGSFDAWITDRIAYTTGQPKTGETGSFDAWITDRMSFADYTEAATVAASVIPVLMASYRRRRV